MVFIEIFVVVLAAIAIGSLFFFVFKTAGPWGSFWIFLMILILAGIAAAAWIKPFGPVYWNVSWVPVLSVIILFALFMAALTPPARESNVIEEEKIPESRQENAAAFTLSFFFWAFIVFLLAVAVWGFFA